MDLFEHLVKKMSVTVMIQTFKLVRCCHKEISR